MMRRLDKQFKRSITETAKLRKTNVKLFVSNLNRFLEKEIPRVASLADDAEALEAASVLGGLQQGLVDAGLESVVRNIRSGYADELSSIATRFSISGIEKALSSADSAVVNALIDNDLGRVTKLISPYIDDISSTLLRTVVGGQKPDISALLESTTDILESQLDTELNTMLAGFSRTVTANKADELGLNLFYYVGPDDKVTRDFCSEVLSKDPPIYSREEIAAMQNDSGVDVLTFGGGYNCRHQWIAITEDDARAMGWNGR